MLFSWEAYLEAKLLEGDWSGLSRLLMMPFSWDTENKGKHVIHTGGEYASFLQVPYIPARYKTVGYDYR